MLFSPIYIYALLFWYLLRDFEIKGFERTLPVTYFTLSSNTFYQKTHVTLHISPFCLSWFSISLSMESFAHIYIDEACVNPHLIA